MWSLVRNLKQCLCPLTYTRSCCFHLDMGQIQKWTADHDQPHCQSVLHGQHHENHRQFRPHPVQAMLDRLQAYRSDICTWFCADISQQHCSWEDVRHTLLQHKQATIHNTYTGQQECHEHSPSTHAVAAAHDLQQQPSIHFGSYQRQQCCPPRERVAPLRPAIHITVLLPQVPRAAVLLHQVA